MIWRKETAAGKRHMALTAMGWQAMKSEIIRELGQTDILLPALVADGLAANDRIKVRMSALQAAAQHAREPGRPASDLSVECHAAKIAPASLAGLIGGAHLAAPGRFAAPDLARLMSDISDDAATMVRAVMAGSMAEGEAAQARLAAITTAGQLEAASEIEFARIARMTAVAQEGADSLHRLVMDLHKLLNRLAADCSEEIIAGAHAFGLHAEDRLAVERFMRGVEETRALKFNHPGLDTMAMRTGNRLLIQNDIGTTDAHVMVIAIEQNTVTVTYSDVHLPRAKFFIALLDRFPTKWSGLDRHAAAGLGEENAFFLVTGTLSAESTTDRDAFLATLGASLVFLIDWNKARKLLRSWVAKDDAVRILDWAARHRIGHRGFLELGGNDLLGAAVRNAAPSRIGFGERLDQALGRVAAIDFLKSALRHSTEALRAGRSARLARDQIEADLVRHLERVDSALLAVVLRQVGLAHDIAADICRHVATLCADRPADGKRLAKRAGHIEQKADLIAIEARKEVVRLGAKLAAAAGQVRGLARTGVGGRHWRAAPGRAAVGALGPAGRGGEPAGRRRRGCHQRRARRA